MSVEALCVDGVQYLTILITGANILSMQILKQVQNDKLGEEKITLTCHTKVFFENTKNLEV